MKNYEDDYFGDSFLGNTLKKAAAVQPRCYESHPPLQIGEYLVYGGSCGHPKVKDADVYIGLDYNMRQTAAAYPWNAQLVEVLYPIKDMQAPDHPEEFKKMIAWLADQLEYGKKVHIGCLGGHGRTGVVLAALYSHMTGDPNAINYVRENYCEKAVESQAQIDFLHKHFGITKAKPNKLHTFKASKGAMTTQAELALIKGFDAPADIFPVESPRTIWKRKKP